MKDSTTLPVYEDLPIQKLVQIFNNTSATYKFYWFLAILDCVEKGENEILKIDLFIKMLSHPWYTVNFFKLSFGSQDLIQSSIEKVQQLENIPISNTKSEIEKEIKFSSNPEIHKILKHFDKNVPHWFLSPWYPKKSKSDIYKLSFHFHESPPYALDKEKIVIESKWFNYFRIHSKLLKEFCYWNLALFLQGRNPNVPDIPNKLIKPAKRNSLTKQRRDYWDKYLQEKNEVRCIFTNKVLVNNHYELDHFIPYAFVSHDLIWNLVPIDPRFNSQKKHKLPFLDLHFRKFFEIQKDAFFTLNQNNRFKKYREEFHTIFPILRSEEDFQIEKFHNVISPLVTTAHNNGFEFL